MDTKTVNETTTIVDALTGEVTIRELTEAEKAQRVIDLDNFATQQANRDAEAEAKASAKYSAEAKLAALGLTADEIAAIA